MATPKLSAHWIADILGNAITAYDDEGQFNRDVAEHLDSGDGGDPEAPAFDRLETYREAGLLTRDAGLVLFLSDGSEYQVTIVRSR